MSTNRQHVATYLTEQQHQQWKRRAEAMDMSLSEYIQAMTEAGHKKFEATVDRDESADELRQQRNDLKEELSHARGRIEALEEQLYQSERREIVEYIEANPGADIDAVIRHVIDTVPGRVNQHIEELEGTEIAVRDGGFHPIEGES